MIQTMVDWLNSTINEQSLLAITIVIVAAIGVCCALAIISLDRDNEEMRIIIEGLLEEKRAAEEEKKQAK